MQISIRRLKSASRHVSRAGAAAGDADSVIGGILPGWLRAAAGRRVNGVHVRAVEEAPDPRREIPMSTYKVGYFVGSLAKASINRLLSKALIRLAPPELAMTELP